MQLTVSVVLCTHNPRPGFFRRALASLQSQNLPLEEWEFLLVDNVSSEVLKDVWDISWHPHGRHIREDQIGLMAARLRGIKESRGELLVFVDDDNVLEQNYLNHALKVSRRHPFLGVFGAGVLEPEFEIDPPRELLKRQDLLALRTVRSAMWTNNANDADCIPWGAGLCVTRTIAERYRALLTGVSATTVVGRRGKRLFSGEDNVFSWLSVEEDQGFGLFPQLKITHLIAAGRLTQSYFVRLIHDHAFSHAVLRYLFRGISQNRLHWTRYLRLLLHGIKNGQFSMRCLWAEFRGEQLAARYIDENGLLPFKTGTSQPPVSVNAPQTSKSDEAVSSVNLSCMHQK